MRCTPSGSPAEARSTGDSNDNATSVRPTGPREPRLARFLSQLFVRGLLRCRTDGLRAVARHQRGPRATWHGLRHARAQRHGNHFLRARGPVVAQGQHGQWLDHHTWRRAPDARGRRAYVDVGRGTVEVNGIALGAGDGARMENEAQITLSKGEGAEIILFDLN